MVNTVDFITPPVDDPYWFGQIAAANAISDVYAMGGIPKTALSIIMFPTKVLDTGLLREILRGGHDKIMEAGACLAGGHSVDDEEPKYGLCVSGTVHPDLVITNACAQTGDILILTKPLGTGVLFNAVRSGKMPYREIEQSVLPQVAALNGQVMDIALRYDLHACTDITGFGIAGHLLEMSTGSGVRASLDYAALPLYPGVMDMYRKGETTGSNEPNRQLVEGKLNFEKSQGKIEQQILYDPQTSGGLLLSVAGAQADSLLEDLSEAGVNTAVKIGEFVEGSPGIDIV